MKSERQLYLIFSNIQDFRSGDSGVVVPQCTASQVDLPRRAYVAQDSMICNFSNRSEGQESPLIGSN